MNRAERRQADRESKKKIILTNAELEEIKKQERINAIDILYAMLYVLPLQALKEMGWGKVRLQRFNDELTRQIRITDYKKENLDSLVKKMVTEYGIVLKNDL